MTATDNQSDDHPVTIIVLGPTGSGKSAFINLVSGSKLRIGEGLDSCTVDVERSKEFVLEGKRIVLVDTPGFDDTTRSDTDVLSTIATYLANMHEKEIPLTGILYFHRISDFRVGGISKRNIEVFHQLCGKSALENVAVVTNMWGEVTDELGNRRLGQLKNDEKYFAPTIGAGGSVLRHENTRHSAESILRTVIDKSPVVLRIQEQIVEQNLDLNKTSAGEVLFRDLQAQEERNKKEQEEMKKEMESASDLVKEELRQEILQKEEEMARVQEQMRKLQRKIQEKRESEKKRMEEQSSTNGEPPAAEPPAANTEREVQVVTNEAESGAQTEYPEEKKNESESESK